MGETWSGYHLCAQADCPLARTNSDFLVTPSGPALDGPYAGAAFEEDSYTTSNATFGYGAWPSGMAVPSSIDWYVEVRRFSDSNSALLDRAPDVGSATAPRLPSGRPVRIDVIPGPATTYGQLRDDRGSVSADGQALEGRQVSVSSPLPQHFRQATTRPGGGSH